MAKKTTSKKRRTTKKRPARKAPARKKATRKKATRRTKTTTRKVKAACGQEVQVERMGSAVMIEYRKGGRLYRHAFNGGVTLYRTKCGNALMIGPVRAGTWIRG